MTATVIGEFSFIIAQLGIAVAATAPLLYPHANKLYALAVGVSIVTTLVSPLVMRRSDRLADALVRRQPRWLADWLSAYHGWQERLAQRSRRNLLWQLSRKRVVQVSVGMLFVTGLVVFSGQLLGLAESWFGPSQRFPHGLEFVFWAVLALVVLAPLVAIWRNFSAMALLYAEMSTRGLANAARLRRLVETGLKFAAGAGMFLWLGAILPMEELATKWVLGSIAVIVVAALIVLRRKLIYWHSEMEVEILSVVESADLRMTATTAPWLQPHGEWNLHMIDCTLPDLADAQGRTIAALDLRSRFGCSVVGIERQGFMIPLPPPDAVLYPRDKVLLMGTTEQVRAGQKFLAAVSGGPVSDSVFEEVRMEASTIPAWSRAVGKTLGELSPAQNFAVQIAGVHRGGLRILNPSAQETLRAGDEVLVLGAPVQIDEFTQWLREKPEMADVKAD
jgi:CPA2 family monovalent cation:H+ antiporter-2